MNTVESGRPQPGVLRLSNPCGHVLGSAVLVGPRWALTVSHVVAMPQRALRVELAGSTRSAGVLALHWLDARGEHWHRVGSDRAWPELRTGENDHPVLLELDSEVSDAGFAEPAVAPQQAGGKVEFRGLGVDADGNYGEHALCCALDYLGLAGDGLTLGRARISAGADAPAQDHSGGGVFSGGPGDALLGLHSHRRALGGEQLAVFAALDTRHRDWILRHREIGPSLQLAANLRPQKLTLRRRHNIFGVKLGHVSFGKKLVLGDTACPCRQLQPATEIELTMEADGVLVLQGRHPSGTRLAARLKPISLRPESMVHCWSGDYESTAGNDRVGKLFLFIRNIDGSGKVKVARLELFVKGSLHRPPDAGNLQDGHQGSGFSPFPLGRPSPLPPGLAATAAITLDQDEEGEGYDELAP